MIGGGAKSEVWCQIFADVLGRPIRQVADPLLANVRGAAAIAAVGLRRLTFEDFAESVHIEEVFHPQPKNRRLYDELYRELLTFYRRNRRSFARLNARGAIK
jgi:xylulokinase